MQDTRTGELKPLDPNFLAGIADRSEEFRRKVFAIAGAAAGIPSQSQGPVFSIGERLTLKGGSFKVHTFGKRFITLESLPS